MAETFVRLADWLRPVSEPPVEFAVVDATIEEAAASHDVLCARVRRLRAAVTEALDCDAPERAALERVRRYADELLERWSP